MPDPGDTGYGDRGQGTSSSTGRTSSSSGSTTKSSTGTGAGGSGTKTGSTGTDSNRGSGAGGSGVGGGGGGGGGATGTRGSSTGASVGPKSGTNAPGNAKTSSTADRGGGGITSKSAQINSGANASQQVSRSTKTDIGGQTVNGAPVSSGSKPSAKVVDPTRSLGPGGPMGAPAYNGAYNANTNSYSSISRGAPQTVNTAGKSDYAGRGGQSTGVKSSTPGKMGPGSTQTGGLTQTVNSGIKTNFGGLPAPGGILGKSAQINSASNASQQVNRAAKSDTPGKMGASSTQSGGFTQTVNSAAKTSLPSPKVAQPNLGGAIGNLAQINSAANPAQQVNRLAQTDLEQYPNREAKTNRAPRMNTNQDAIDAAMRAKDAVTQVLRDAYDSVFGPTEQTVNSAAKGSLPPSALGADINLNRGMAPYMSGDIAMQNAISKPYGATDYGENFAASLLSNGLGSAQESMNAGRSAPSMQPGKIQGRVAPPGGLTRSIVEVNGLPAATGEEGIIAPQRMVSPLDQARQERFAQIASARGQLAPGASIVPAGNILDAAAAPTNPFYRGPAAQVQDVRNKVAMAQGAAPAPPMEINVNGGMPTSMPGGLGVVAYNSLAASRRPDVTTAQRDAMYGGGPSVAPSQEGDMVAPSQQYDGAVNRNPMQDDSQPQDLQELYNRYQYEKQRAQQGYRDLPGRIWDAIVNGEITGYTPPADSGGKDVRDSGSNAYAPVDVDAVLAEYLRQLEAEQAILGNRSQMDLVFNTFV